jgi:hypothetical protein
MDAIRTGPRGELYLLSVHTFAHVYGDTGELFVTLGRERSHQLRWLGTECSESLWSAVGAQHLGHRDMAVLVLVRLYEGDQEPGRHGCPVQGVDKAQ